MPTDVKIIHAQDFIKATPEGYLDFEESKRILKEIVSVSAGLADYDVILDTRKAHPVLSVTDLWYLSAELNNHGQSFSRMTAVLCPLKQFDKAGFFALCSQNRGSQVSAFTSYEKALGWLHSSRPLVSGDHAE